MILPPNFIEAATRGKMMMVLEAASDRGRVPLNALPKDQAFTFDNVIPDSSTALRNWLAKLRA